MTAIFRTRSAAVLALLLSVVLLVIGALPAAAEEAAKQSEIRLKLGSGQMNINGETVKIQQAPYASAGHVMVPLAVFTNPKGFGAKVQLTNNKIIKLTYGKHVAVLTLGSKAATIDGKKLTLPVAPASKQGVAMVPLTPLAKSFGASQAKDETTKEIVIKFKAAAGAAGGKNSAIDTDAGKSQIGDSYYQWSMNYPTGLVKSAQSQDGDSLIFEDVKKEYYLGIFVEEARNTMSVNEKRSAMTEYQDEGEKTVDKKTVGEGDKSYERIITKFKSGFFYEYRGFQANGFFYIIVYGKRVGSASELTQSGSLLDSFRTSFDRSSSSIKDMTQILDGFKSFTDEDYGLNVKLPKEWKVDEKSTYPYYETEDAYLYLDVTSVVAGDTLDAWVKRKTTRLEQSFAPAYRKEPELKDVIWNGIPAKAMKISYSWDTERWWEEYEIFAVEGKYRYYTSVAYLKSSASKYSNLMDTVLRTMKVDFATVEKNMGDLPDDYDNADREAKVTKQSDKYGYRVTLPEFWYGDQKNFEEATVEYSFVGGLFSVEAWEESYSFYELDASISEFYREKTSKSSKYRLISKQQTQYAGYTAIKVVTEDTTNTNVSPYRMIEYYVLKGDKVYRVWGAYFLANGSEFVIRNLENTLSSLTFVEGR